MMLAKPRMLVKARAERLRRRESGKRTVAVMRRIFLEREVGIPTEARSCKSVAVRMGARLRRVRDSSGAGTV